MFGFGKKKHISDVYRLLNNHHEMSAHKTKAEDLFGKDDIERIFDMSGDINTTVTLVLLMMQSVFAERFFQGAPYEETARWASEEAPIDGLSARQWIETDTASQISAAKEYADSFKIKVENGLVHSNREVILFANDRIERMLCSWDAYREKMITTYDELFL